MNMRNLLAPFVATAAVGLVAFAPSNSYADGWRHHSRSGFSIALSTPGFSIGYSSGYGGDYCPPCHYYAPVRYYEPRCYVPAPVYYVERPVYRVHRVYYSHRPCF